MRPTKLAMPRRAGDLASCYSRSLTPAGTLTLAVTPGPGVRRGTAQVRLSDGRGAFGCMPARRFGRQAGRGTAGRGLPTARSHDRDW